MHCCPRECKHSAGECTRDEHVESAETVRHGVGNKTTKDGPRVEDGNEVKCKSRIGASFEVCVGCDVKEGDIEAREAEKKTSGAEHEGGLAKRGDIKKFAAGGGQDTLAHNDVREAEGDQGDEADGSGRPTKADPRLQRMEQCRVDDATCIVISG